MGQMRCTACGGSGGTEAQPCEACDGSGDVWDGERERYPNDSAQQQAYERAWRLKKELRR